MKVICVMCVCAASHFLDCDTIQESVHNQCPGCGIFWHDFMMHGMEMLIGDSGHEGEKKKERKGNSKHDMHFPCCLRSGRGMRVVYPISNGSNGREPRVFH